MFPLTENGLDASSVERIAGAAMPPIAADLPDEELLVADEDEEVEVPLENGVEEEIIVGALERTAEAVEDDLASTVTVPVTTAHDVVWLAAAELTDTNPAPASIADWICALFARALDPSLAASFLVVPEPVTVNFVQSS